MLCYVMLSSNRSLVWADIGPFFDEVHPSLTSNLKRSPADVTMTCDGANVHGCMARLTSILDAPYDFFYAIKRDYFYY